MCLYFGRVPSSTFEGVQVLPGWELGAAVHCVIPCQAAQGGARIADFKPIL